MKIRKALGTAGRVLLQSLPYLGLAIVVDAQAAHAAINGAALPGITQGGNAVQGSLQYIGGAVGIGGLAYGGVQLVHKHDWVTGMSTMGAGGAACYVATQAVPISALMGAGATF